MLSPNYYKIFELKSPCYGLLILIGLKKTNLRFRYKHFHSKKSLTHTQNIHKKPLNSSNGFKDLADRCAYLNVDFVQKKEMKTKKTLLQPFKI